MGNVNIQEAGVLLTAEEREEAQKADEAYYQDTFGMSQKEYEAKATEEVAKVAHFERIANSHYFRCILCGKRFHENYYGADLNLRMLDHYEGHTPRAKERLKALLERVGGTKIA